MWQVGGEGGGVGEKEGEAQGEGEWDECPRLLAVRQRPTGRANQRLWNEARLFPELQQNVTRI